MKSDRIDLLAKHGTAGLTTRGSKGRNKLNEKLIIFLSLIALLWISGCAPKARMAAPSMSAPSPSPVSVSRYAQIEAHFKTIDASIDPEEMYISIQEVLDMCESDESIVTITEHVDGMDISISSIKIREYIEMLRETPVFNDKIDEVYYNEEGKIIYIDIYREVDLDEISAAQLEEAARLEEEQAVEANIKTFAPAPPPPAPSASRYAPIENHFKIIASSNDFEVVNSSTMQVLEMCESGEIPVMIMIKFPEPELLYVGVREYMLILSEDKVYEDKIDYIEYNDEGKIINMNLVRE